MKIQESNDDSFLFDFGTQDLEADESETEDPPQPSTMASEYLRLPSGLLVEEDEGEEGFEIGHVGDHTPDDLLKHLFLRRKRLDSTRNRRGAVVRRCNDARQRLRALDMDSQTQNRLLLEIDEHMDVLKTALSIETDNLQRDVEDLRDAFHNACWAGMSESTSHIQEPADLRSTTRWSPTIPEHRALHRVFKVDDIPLIPGTWRVDYSKIRKGVFRSSPMLNLNLYRVPPESMATELSTRVVIFCQKFERLYRWNLTEDLFDKMAWYYMSDSLTKVSGLAQEYLRFIAEVPVEERTWRQVVTSLHKALLKLELLERSAFDKEYNIKPIKPYLQYAPGVSDRPRVGQTPWLSINQHGVGAESQAVGRTQVAPNVRRSVRAPSHKRPNPSTKQSADQDYISNNNKKKQKQKDICQFHSNCKRLQLRHSLDQCFHWQNAQKKYGLAFSTPNPEDSE